MLWTVAPAIGLPVSLSRTTPTTGRVGGAACSKVDP